MKNWLQKYKQIISFVQVRRHLLNTNRNNLIVYFILFVVFVAEVLVYFLTTFTWFSIACNWKSECTRILLVADPQLIGLHNEHSSLLTPFSIWDSDRYLAKTFSYAFRFVQPDVVIFLGDLLDEGSTGTDDEFRSYLRRLFNIFLRKPHNSVHHIWLPGDNDIGGEGNDRITSQKIKRFERAFLQPDVIGIKNIKFYKINRLTSVAPKMPQPRGNFESVNNIVIGLSHLPLLMAPAVFVDKVLEKLQPHLLFTAHTHKSMIVSTQTDLSKDRLITPVRPDTNQVYTYYLGINEIYEILVPTCSYRMGTTKIGYGFAVIERGSLQYTVLWSPSRFPQLILYGIIAICGLAYVVFSYRKCGKNDNSGQYTRLNHIA